MNPDNLTEEEPPAIDRWILRAWERFGSWLFQGKGVSGAWPDMLLLAGCYLAGIVHWIGFFNGGRLDYTAHDWPKEMSYLRVIREALVNFKLPLYLSASIQGTDCYLGLPETLLSPQVLLLRWMDPRLFAMTNVLILFTVGFVGCSLLRRHLDLSPFGFLTLFLLLNFNGYVTSRIAVGHFMWAACLLLPFLVWTILQAGGGQRDRGISVLAAWVLTAILFQGAFHLWIWCLMFLVLLGLGSVPHRSFSFRAIVLATLLGSFRLIPAVVCLSGRENRFLSGYPTLTELLAGFAVLRSPDYPVTGASFGETGWWEYDIFVGLAGLALLLWFGVGKGLAGSSALSNHRALRCPVLGMTFLAMSDVWACVAFAPVPFAAVERVSSRFIILPFVFVLALACSWLSRKSSGWGRWPWILCLALLTTTALELAQHSIKWRPGEMERQIREGKLQAVSPPPEIMNLRIAEGSHAHYPEALVGSGLLSLGGLVTSLVWWRRRDGVEGKSSSL